MKRRNFIQLTALGTAVPLISLNSCVTDETKEHEDKANSSPFELEEKSVAELQNAMESGQYSSKSICEIYLERIKKFRN